MMSEYEAEARLREADPEANVWANYSSLGMDLPMKQPDDPMRLWRMPPRVGDTLTLIPAPAMGEAGTWQVVGVHWSTPRLVHIDVRLVSPDEDG